jgi:hypothetical protein
MDERRYCDAMMVETPDADSGDRRSLSNLETRLVEHLIRAAAGDSDRLIASLERAKVREMDDGGQGSLRFEQLSPRRRYGRQLSEFRFTDLDGVPVSATLNLDQFGDLYELDIFKGNFGVVLTLPDEFE